MKTSPFAPYPEILVDAELTQSKFLTVSKMLAAEDINNERTILDYLDEPCWRAVLQYVPAQDLIRTERASRRWQVVLLTYLQGVRIIIEEDEKKTINHNTCSLKPSGYKSFKKWTKKLGPSVTSIYCSNLVHLAMVKKNCPNLDILQLSRLDCVLGQLLPYNLNDNFKFVREVSFNLCDMADNCVSEFIADKALEKLKICDCSDILGTCFDTLNVSDLKSLVVEYSESFRPRGSHTIIDRIVLDSMMPSLLNKMPKLEHVELIGVNTSICGDVPEHLSRVPRLRHLSTTYQLEQRHVELITKRCQELRSLELLNCESLTGIDVIWRQAGSRLTSLKLDQLFSASDDNIVELIKGCPRLQSLTIGGAEALTCALPARAAAARRAASPGRPLRLDLSYTNLSDEYYLRLEDRGLERNAQYEELKAKYEDLIIVLEKTMDEYDDEQSEESSSDYNYFDYSDYEYDDDYDYIYPGPFMRYE